MADTNENNESKADEPVEKKDSAETEKVPAQEEKKIDAEKTEAPATETPKAETPKAETLKAEAPKAEQPQAAPVNTAPKKQKKAFPWKPVLEVAGVVVLSAGCGFGGGYLAGTQASQSAISNAESEMQNSKGFSGMTPDQFSPDSMPDQGSGSSSDTTTTGAALGIYVQTNSSNQVVIAGFSDTSNAQTAGLQTGDIITSLDGTAVSTYEEITEFLSTKSAGDKVKVVVNRSGSEVSATITLVEKTNTSSSSGSSSGSGTTGRGSGSLPSKGGTDSQSGATSGSSSSSSSSSLQG